MHTVRSGYTDVELVSPLSNVGGGLRGDGRTPEGTLVVGDAIRVGARIGGVPLGVSLHVDVDAVARRSGIAVLFTVRCCFHRIVVG